AGPSDTELQELRRSLGELATLALEERDMACDGFGLEPLCDRGQAVAGRVDVGIVDLVGVAGQHDLRVGAAAGDDRLDLVRREVLRLVHDRELVRERAPPNVREWLDLNRAGREQLLVATSGVEATAAGREDVLEVVEDRAH